MTVNDPNIIFISLPVMICLCIDIEEIKLLSSLSQWKRHFREKFIRLIYSFNFSDFSEYASSILSQKKNVLCKKINFRETIKLGYVIKMGYMG